jgi:lipid-A-disaccharide synthase
VTSVFVSAIDASADLHAAQWVEELRRLRPGIRVFGAGGVAMEKAGVEILVSQRELAVAGVVEVLEILPRVFRVWRQLERHVREERPGLGVLIDAPDFHFPLARRLKRRGLPLLYYIGPNVRRWRRGRTDTLAQRVDRLASIFPFEPELYAHTPLRVDYVGHPMVHPLRAFAESWDRQRARAELGFAPDVPLVALAPGSRRNELRHMLGLYAETARTIRERDPRVRFALCVAPTMRAEDLESALPRPAKSLGIELVAGHTHAVLVAADAALLKPGSITMEAALLGCPLVVAGRAHPLTAALLRRAVKDPCFAMPNALADEHVVPELLQEQATPQALATEVLSLLEGPARERQREAFQRIRRRLGEGSAARHTAEITDTMLRQAAAS